MASPPMKTNPLSGSEEARAVVDPTPPKGALARATAWAKTNPWLTAAIGLLLASVIVLAVVLPVCLIHGCPAHNSNENKFELPPGVTRLMVTFDGSKDALDVIPAVLRDFVTSVRLDTSNIQILDFVDEEVLQEALTYLRADTDLSFLVRDFEMGKPIDGPTLPPVPSPKDIQNVINTVTALGGRRLLSLSPTTHAEESGGGSDKTADTGMDMGDRMGRDLAQVAVNDPMYVNGYQWYMGGINATGAWGRTTGVPTIVVAVVDSGADMTHPDLTDNFWVNTREIPNNGIDDDGNGFIDDVNGWDFAGGCTQFDAFGNCLSCTQRNTPQCSNAHGTHVAGLVAAIQNNARGITGVAPNVRVMVLRVTDCKTGGILSSNVMAAYDYAAKMGAHIVSCSFGTNYQYEFTPMGPAPSYHADWIKAYTIGIQPLMDKNILVVAAAGNEHINMDLLKKYNWAYLPCTVDLPNVMCVGATDQSNQAAYFSNYGATVIHVGAPGMWINSTLWEANPNPDLTHTYGIMHGTSMSTPIVSGVAALALSVLSASDGNYYKALQVKNVLLKSATKVPGSALPWMSSANVNAGNAVVEAANSLTIRMPLLGPKLTSLPQAIMYKGLTETYYRAAGNQYSQDISGGLADKGIQRGLSPTQMSSYAGFRHGFGYLVSIEGLTYLGVTGIYSVQLDTMADINTVGFYVNGAAVDINPTTKQAVFSVQTFGYFSFELRIAYPSARVAYTVRAPNSASYVYVNDFLALPPTPPASNWGVPNYGIDAKLSTGWQVFYNKVASANVTLEALQAVSSSDKFEYTTAVEELEFQRGELIPFLFPTEPSVTAAIGVATARLKNKNYANGLRLTANCKGCQVLINGLVVLDSWESLGSATSLYKEGPCLDLRQNDLSRQAYEITVKFASNPLSEAFLHVRWADGCMSPSGLDVYTGRPMLETISSSTVWHPVNASIRDAGYIGGLQCDVWRGDNGQPTLSIPSALWPAIPIKPTFKIRLPNCPNSALEAPSSVCNLQWRFTLDNIFPGLTAKTAARTTFAVRCWTYVPSNKFKTNILAVVPATSTAYLGGRKVWGSPDSVPPPSKTNLGQQWQQFAVEWVNVPSGTVLSVTDNGIPLSIDLLSMKLPIVPIASFTGVNDRGIQVATSSPAGAVTKTVLAVRGDIANLVHYNLDLNYAGPSVVVADNNHGLDVPYDFGATMASKLRYTDAEGFLFPLNQKPQPYTIQVDEVAGATSMVVMGGVTVMNPKKFVATSLATSLTFQVYLPGWVNIYTRVIVKSQNADPKTYFRITTLQTPAQFDPNAAAASAWDTWQWAPTQSTACAYGLAPC